MDRRAELIQSLKEVLIDRHGDEIFKAKVKKVDEDNNSCVVLLDGDEERKIENVRLKASVDDKEEFFVTYPREDSWVLCGKVQGGENDLIVIACDEVDKVKLKVDKHVMVATKEGLKIEVDKQKVHTNEDEVLIESEGGGKVTVKNEGVLIESEKGGEITVGNLVTVKNTSANLKDILMDITTVIETLKVMTPMGPSAAILPDSLAQLIKLKAKLPQLLQ